MSEPIDQGEPSVKLYLNYDSTIGRVIESDFCVAGTECSDNDSFLRSMLSGETCYTADYDLISLKGALEDGGLLSDFDTDQETVEELHMQVLETSNAPKTKVRVYETCWDKLTREQLSEVVATDQTAYMTEFLARPNTTTLRHEIVDDANGITQLLLSYYITAPKLSARGQ